MSEMAIPPSTPEMLPWQQRVAEVIEKALAEGRTELRYFQGRRGGFWSFVTPQNGSPDE